MYKVEWKEWGGSWKNEKIVSEGEKIFESLAEAERFFRDKNYDTPRTSCRAGIYKWIACPHWERVR